MTLPGMLCKLVQHVSPRRHLACAQHLFFLLLLLNRDTVARLARARTSLGGRVDVLASVILTSFLASAADFSFLVCLVFLVVNVLAPKRGAPGHRLKFNYVAVFALGRLNRTPRCRRPKIFTLENKPICSSLWCGKKAPHRLRALCVRRVSRHVSLELLAVGALSKSKLSTLGLGKAISARIVKAKRRWSSCW